MIGQMTIINWVNQHYEGATYSELSNNCGFDEDIIREKSEEFMDKYPRPEWAVRQILRMSGLVEDISENFCGHPNRGWLSIHDGDGKHGYGIPGCTGEG